MTGGSGEVLGGASCLVEFGVCTMVHCHQEVYRNIYRFLRGPEESAKGALCSDLRGCCTRYRLVSERSWRCMQTLCAFLQAVQKLVFAPAHQRYKETDELNHLTLLRRAAAACLP